MNKSVLICGASSGIGLSTAKLFLSNGYMVYTTSRKKPDIESKRLVHFYSDFYDNKSIENVCKKVINTSKGNLNIVINCVGDIIHEKEIKDFDIELLYKTFQINYFSAFILSKYLFNTIAHNEGCFAFISSVAKEKVYPLISDYCSAKSALSNFTKSLASELSVFNARAIAVSPAVVKTPLFLKANFTQEEAEKMHKLNRIGNPEEIAELIYYLTGIKSSWITGVDYTIDGGMLL